MFGQINLAQFTECRLPQKAQSAFDAVFGGLVGVSYKPVLYKGEQEVHGKNYYIFVEQTTLGNPQARQLFQVCINESRNKDGQVEYTLENKEEI